MNLRGSKGVLLSPDSPARQMLLGLKGYAEWILDVGASGREAAPERGLRGAPGSGPGDDFHEVVWGE